ncbi:MAG: c-type cytochrome biogenesis protein CcsB [Bacteroidales bacterium]|nr:c-type cytochrome biogenesis protein CcsB [Bacteroidales bacterium]
MKLLKKTKSGMLLIHFSFIIILTGAFITFLFGKDGMMHIREGECQDTYFINYSNGNAESYKLPFSVCLKKFTLNRYPGSNSPSSYESSVEIKDGDNIEKTVIKMNRIFSRHGYRLYQSSYDKDERGTILSVNYDPIGMGVSYFGYFILLVGFITSFLQKNGRFRTLLRKLNSYTSLKSLILVLFFLSSISSFGLSVDMKDFAPSKDHALLFSELSIQNENGRIEPLNTFAAQFLRKIARKNNYQGLTPEQVLLGFIAYPEQWNEEPLMKVGNDELKSYLKLKEKKKISYNDLFDGTGNYKLSSILEDIYSKPESQKSKFDKEVLKINEKINLIYLLENDDLLKLFPKENDGNKKWYTEKEADGFFEGKDSMFVSKIIVWYAEELKNGIESNNYTKSDEIVNMIASYQRARSAVIIDYDRSKAEIIYNKLNIFSSIFRIYLISGFLLLVVSMLRLFKETKTKKYLSLFFIVVILSCFAFHSYGIALRWYISQQAPWSNSYETMVYVAWASMFSGLLFLNRSKICFSLSSIMTGLLLFVANLNWLDPQITPLVPVLKSYWLMLHVSVITAAYGFFGTSFLLGVIYLFMEIVKDNNSKIKIQMKELTIINEMSVLVGVGLLAIGIFFGAIWANESWGRYWGWDPKETWALITMVVYAILIHLRLVKKFNGEFKFNVFSVFAVLTVLMTFFGVNYFLSGLHSYGKTDMPPILMPIILFFVLMAFIVFYISNKRKKLNIRD